MERRAFLYLVTNTINGKKYVGIAINPRDRWRNHRKMAGKRKRFERQTYLQKAMGKEGRDNFTFEVIACAFSWDDGLVLERTLIEQHQTFVKHGGYNLTLGGEGKCGTIFSAETRAKIGAATAKRRHTPETKAQIGASGRGKKRSAETKANMSRVRQTPEAKARMRAAALGRKHSAETKAKQSAAKMGWKPSPETIDRMKIAARARADKRKKGEQLKLF